MPKKKRAYTKKQVIPQENETSSDYYVVIHSLHNQKNIRVIEADEFSICEEYVSFFRDENTVLVVKHWELIEKVTVDEATIIEFSQAAKSYDNLECTKKNLNELMTGVSS